jgi:outer membrane cobalamin receptor
MSAEIGMRFGLSARTEIDAAVFYNEYEDLISYQQVSAPLEPLAFRVINLTKALMQGGELNLNYTLPDKLNLRLGYTYLDARDVSPGRLNDVLAYKVKHTVTGSATGYFGDFVLNASARYRSAIEEVFIYPGSEPDANFLVHAKLAYRLLDKHHIYVAVNNITDKQYEELERYRMAGRSYTAGMMFIF